jgi:hypothetical protein
MRDFFIKIINHLINQGWSIDFDGSLYLFDSAGINSSFGYKDGFTIFFTSNNNKFSYLIYKTPVIAGNF